MKKSKPLTKYESLSYLLGQYGTGAMDTETFWKEMQGRGYTQACIDDWCEQYYQLEAKKDDDNARREREKEQARAARAATSRYAGGESRGQQEDYRPEREDDWRSIQDQDQSEGQGESEGRGRQDQGSGEGQGRPVQSETVWSRSLTTNKHREFARKHAEEIWQHHRSRGLAGTDANHVAANIEYRESLYRGLLAECDFAVKFRVLVNREIFEYGDDGIDFLLDLREHGVTPVNIKAKSVQVSWPALMRSGTHLRIPVSEVMKHRENTIYVFAIYREREDDAQVLRWAWRRDLIERNERMLFENGNDEECFTMPFEQLLLLPDLKEMIVGQIQRTR